MKDGGRLAAAMEVLGTLETLRRPAQDALKDWGLSHRFAGSRDRLAIGNLVFDALRKRASLSALMGEETPRAIVLATYALSWQRGVEGLEAVLAEDRHAPAPLTDSERAALVSGQVPDDAPDWVQADVPDWLAASLTRALGSRLVEEGRAIAARAPLDLRVNTLKSGVEESLGALSSIGTTRTPYSPVGLRIAPGDPLVRAPHLPSEAAWRKGWVEIQDEGSQLAALMAGAGPGMQVVDLCAGAGGKTLALAAAMENSGQIYAYDADRRRFGNIRERIERAGARNVQIREPKPSALDDLEGHADVVIVDAPCTGTGTWRRRPDAKWRLAPGGLRERIREQSEVLETASKLVRPGGRLAYVTCSLLPEENEDQVTAFLDAAAGFSLADPLAAFAAAAGGVAPEGAAVALGRHGFALRLTPALTGTDGFFVALLERAAP